MTGECFTTRADKVAVMAAPQTSSAYADFITVLVLVGLPAGPVSRALSRHAIDSSPDGVLVNVFDDLVRLPRYNEALENRGTPEAVVALRMAAAEADAVLVVTSYRGRVPLMARRAIDWLTRRRCALHDRPLTGTCALRNVSTKGDTLATRRAPAIAVVGQSAGCYSGVWSRQIEDAHRYSEPRVMEPLTVPTLRDAVKKLADEVCAGGAGHFVAGGN